MKYCICTLLLLLSLPLSARELLVVGEAFPPFEYLDGEKPVGADIDLLTEIYAQSGIQLRFRIIPFSRAWRMIQTGKADVVLSTSRKDKRMPFVHYSEDHTWQTEVVFFTQHKQPGFNYYQDIKDKNLSIAIVRENSYHPSFWRHFPDQADGSKHPQLVEVRDNDHALLILKHGRVDMVIMDRTVGRTLIKDNNWHSDITWYPKVLYGKPYPIAFSKQSTHPQLELMRQHFNQNLAIMKSNGRYNAIMCRWQALPVSQCIE